MRRNLTPLLLSLVVLIVGSRISPHFLDFAYLRDSATLLAEIGIIAIAMNFVISAGQIDLSVGSNMVLTACLTAKMLAAGLPPIVCFASGLVIATLLGYLNGVLITFFKAPSFLITVATLAIFRGAAKAMLGPTSVKIPADLIGIDTVTAGGLTVPLLILLMLTVMATFVLNKTVFGRWVIAVGANPRTALFSGVPVERVIRSTFLITGFCCGIASLLLLSRLGVARSDLAMGSELDIITIVVVGGTAIQGGSANVVGSLLAFFLLTLLRTAMGVASVTAEYQMTIIGILLIAVVLAKRVSFQSIVKKFKSSGPKPT
ncbi:MAG: ABC transporter permease [Armatimonadetes bacterium]|nr:ABC transporter permease [Armatimonadota bacterium]